MPARRLEIAGVQKIETHGGPCVANSKKLNFVARIQANESLRQDEATRQFDLRWVNCLSCAGKLGVFTNSNKLIANPIGDPGSKLLGHDS